MVRTIEFSASMHGHLIDWLQNQVNWILFS